MTTTAKDSQPKAVRHHRHFQFELTLATMAEYDEARKGGLEALQYIKGRAAADSEKEVNEHKKHFIFAKDATSAPKLDLDLYFRLPVGFYGQSMCETSVVRIHNNASENIVAGPNEDALGDGKQCFDSKITCMDIYADIETISRRESEKGLEVSITPQDNFDHNQSLWNDGHPYGTITKLLVGPADMKAAIDAKRLPYIVGDACRDGKSTLKGLFKVQRVKEEEQECRCKACGDRSRAVPRDEWNHPVNVVKVEHK